MSMRVLPSRAIAYLDEKGRAEVLRCSWLVEVATGNPEPDFPSDLYRVEDCGAVVRSLDGTDDHTTCDAGHVRHAYGSPEWQADDLEFEARQRAGVR